MQRRNVKYQSFNHKNVPSVKPLKYLNKKVSLNSPKIIKESLLFRITLSIKSKLLIRHFLGYKATRPVWNVLDRVVMIWKIKLKKKKNKKTACKIWDRSKLKKLKLLIKYNVLLNRITKRGVIAKRKSKMSGLSLTKMSSFNYS